jgi:hypothetical protein
VEASEKELDPSEAACRRNIASASPAPSLFADTGIAIPVAAGDALTSLTDAAGRAQPVNPTKITSMSASVLIRLPIMRMSYSS